MMKEYKCGEKCPIRWTINDPCVHDDRMAVNFMFWNNDKYIKNVEFFFDKEDILEVLNDASDNTEEFCRIRNEGDEEASKINKIIFDVYSDIGEYADIVDGLLAKGYASVRHLGFLEVLEPLMQPAVFYSEDVKAFLA